MGKSQEESKLAVDSGYWPLYRFNPQLKDQGKNPFILECKEPNGKLQEFLSGEIRYASLQALKDGSNTVALDDLTHGIRRELAKEGKVA